LLIKKIAAFGLAATAAFATATALAGAHSNSAPTQVVIEGSYSHYFGPPKAPDAIDLYGRVLSPRHTCAVDRRLNVFRDDPGADTKLGHATSDSNGGWSFMIPLEDVDFSRDYYATAPKRKLPHHKSCHADTSDPFTMSP
jgi:hypothetical protein